MVAAHASRRPIKPTRGVRVVGGRLTKATKQVVAGQGTTDLDELMAAVSIINDMNLPSTMPHSGAAKSVANQKEGSKTDTEHAETVKAATTDVDMNEGESEGRKTTKTVTTNKQCQKQLNPQVAGARLTGGDLKASHIDPALNSHTPDGVLSAAKTVI